MWPSSNEAKQSHRFRKPRKLGQRIANLMPARFRCRAYMPLGAYAHVAYQRTHLNMTIFPVSYDMKDNGAASPTKMSDRTNAAAIDRD